MLDTAQYSFVTARLRPGMGTFIAVEAESKTRQISDLGLEAAFRAVALVERLMHPTRPGSDLAALHDCPLAAPLTVHPWTWSTLELCKQLNSQSLGIFDPCLPGSRGRLSDLELGPAHCVTAHVRMTLDLGGIAKGFAVDRAIEALRAAGCDGGMVNAGGDLAVFGGREREIGCRHRDGRTRVIRLRNAALATSEVENADCPPEHRGYYDGSNLLVQVSGYAAVTASRAAVADGLTKCLLAGAKSLNCAMLRAFDARRIDDAES